MIVFKILHYVFHSLYFWKFQVESFHNNKRDFGANDPNIRTIANTTITQQHYNGEWHRIYNLASYCT